MQVVLLFFCIIIVNSHKHVNTHTLIFTIIHNFKILGIKTFYYQFLLQVHEKLKGKALIFPLQNFRHQLLLFLKVAHFISYLKICIRIIAIAFTSSNLFPLFNVVKKLSHSQQIRQYFLNPQDHFSSIKTICPTLIQIIAIALSTFQDSKMRIFILIQLKSN